MKMNSGMMDIGRAGLLTVSAEGICAENSFSGIKYSEGFVELSGDTCCINSAVGQMSLKVCAIPRNQPKGLRPINSHEGTVQFLHGCLRLLPTAPCELTDFSISFDFMAQQSDLWSAAKESFHWIPGIKAAKGDVVGDHLFRSPAAIVTTGTRGAALIPILEGDTGLGTVNRYLDLRFSEGAEPDKAPVLVYGAGLLELSGHVYFRPSGKPYPVGAEGVELSFYVLLFEDASKNNIVQTVADFLWETYASKYVSSLLPQTVPFTTYAKYGNGMALQYLWEGGPEPSTGGICLSTLQREDGVMRGREYADDIWFHAWFNNMRTAMELAAFGKWMDKPGWVEKSRSVAACLLAAPQREGIFPTIYAPHDGGWMGSSADHGGAKDLYSLPDCSWSALWLRKYAAEHENLPGTDDFLLRYRAFLYRHQNPSGGFPCWLAADTLSHDSRLEDSASGALPIWFLGEEVLCGAVGAGEREVAVQAVRAGADHLLCAVLPDQRFEDFELYYSCSPKPLGFYDNITCMYGQNTLAMQWCAEALRVAWLITGEPKYLDGGLFSLNILCLYQQVWRHPGLDFYSFGGFGVMNTDGEWNDARQAQFAEMLSNYYQITGNFAYLQRAVAAMRASFALMAIEENKAVCPRNYKGTAINFEVHGNSAENYGHSGANERSYQSGFHWGTGSALVAAARLREQYGDLFIDVANLAAVGIDGIVVDNVAICGNIIELVIETLPGQDPFKIKVFGEPAGGCHYHIVIDQYDVADDDKTGLYLAKRLISC